MQGLTTACIYSQLVCVPFFCQGDTLVLKCDYNSMERDGVTLVSINGIWLCQNSTSIMISSCNGYRLWFTSWLGDECGCNTALLFMNMPCMNVMFVNFYSPSCIEFYFRGLAMKFVPQICYWNLQTKPTKIFLYTDCVFKLPIIELLCACASL